MHCCWKECFRMFLKRVGPAVTLSKDKRNKTNRVQVLRHVLYNNTTGPFIDIKVA
jgi:hypothetical protein